MRASALHQGVQSSYHDFIFIFAAPEVFGCDDNCALKGILVLLLTSHESLDRRTSQGEIAAKVRIQLVKKEECDALMSD